MDSTRCSGLLPGPGLQGGGFSAGAGGTRAPAASLQVVEGEVLAILGPNGAGKTTLFRLLALIERPDAGWIKYFGATVDLHDLAARRRTAAVFQRPLLFQGSVEENVGYGLRFRRLSRRELRAKVHETLDLMGIARLAEADMRTLSGGEMQRVALARALVLEPEILFLDEPTSNLDVHVRRRFREDLRRVVEHLAATVIIITHEHNEALALAQRVAVIQDGAVVQIGTPRRCSLTPRTPLWPISQAPRPSGTVLSSRARRASAPYAPEPGFSWKRYWTCRPEPRRRWPYARRT